MNLKMIALSSGTLYKFSPEQIFRIASEAGYEFIELILRSETEPWFNETWDTESIKNLSEKFKIKISSLHAPFDFKKNTSSFSKIEEFRSSVGNPPLIVHCPREGERYEAWFSNHYFAQNSFLIAENVSFKREKNKSIYDLKEGKFKKLPRICLDLSHALYDIDAFEILSILQKKNVFQIHASLSKDGLFHLPIIEDQSLFKKIFPSGKNLNIIVEISFKALESLTHDELVDHLKQTRIFLEDLNHPEH